MNKSLPPSPRSPYDFHFRHHREPNGNDGYSAMNHISYSIPNSRTPQTYQYPMMPSTSGSQFKVSEIVNPDGSITIRNLLIKDGIWTKEEQEIDSQQHESFDRPSNWSARGTRNDHTQNIIDRTPAMNRANFFEDTDPYSSSEFAVKHYSEAVAHRLRRQRLAQSSVFFDASTNCTSGNRNPKYAQHEGRKSTPSTNDGDNPYTTRSREPFRRARALNTIMYLPTNSSTPSELRNAGSKNTKTTDKHVAFSEPLSSTPTKAGRDAISSAENIKNGTDFLYHTKMNETLMDIYNDADITGYHPVKQSFSSGLSDADSSIFDDVVQTSRVDRILGRLEDGCAQNIATPKFQKMISYVDDDNEKDIPKLYSVTVHKTSKVDKIGIYVHCDSFFDGNRLVVSKVAPDGKFAKTRIQEGDIVVSINGEDMTENPNLEKALSIVTSATDSVTIVVHKDFDVNDSQSAAQTSISSISKELPSNAFPRDYPQMNEKNAEHLGNVAQEYNSEKLEARALKDDTTKSERMTGDGIMLISKDSGIHEPVSVKMKESWKVSGVIVVSIENTLSMLENIGLQIGVKETSTRQVLCISDISPSSMFTKTPLRVGDIVIAINSVSFCDNTNVVDAYSALEKPGERITIVAKKGEESLNDFLHDGRRQSFLPQHKSIYSTLESVNTASTSQTSGTGGTTISGESTRNTINDGIKSCNSTYTEDMESSKSPGRGVKCMTPSRDGGIGMESTVTEQNASASVNSSASILGSERQFESPAKGLQLLDKGKHLKKGGSGKRQKVLVTVIKNHQRQKIGLDFAVLNKKLVVTEVNSSGLLRNAPLGFGDMILSINSVGFQLDPVAQEAASIIRNSPKRVTIEILKTENTIDKRNVDVKTKSCLPSTLFWHRQRKFE